MNWDLDFTGDNPATLDAGGKLTPGWYRAKFTKQEDDQNSGGARMMFAVSTGPFSGKTVNRMLWNPQFANDSEKRERAIKHAKSWAYRLGLITKEQMAKGGTASINWNAVAGREYVIEVTPQKEKNDDGKYVPGNFVEVAYLGVYQFDHPDIPANVRTALQLGPARARDASDGPPQGRAGAAAPAPGTPPAGGGGGGGAAATPANAAAPGAGAQVDPKTLASIWN